jgi:hypothetical protein
MNIFVNFPVDDVARSRAFYTALGWRLDESMSSDEGVCFLIDDDKYVMAISRAMYERVGATEALVGGPGTPSPVTVAFSLDSREAVDDLLARAEAAGARIGDTDDYDFMYQRQFDDPDGYHYSPFWARSEHDASA